MRALPLVLVLALTGCASVAQGVIVSGQSIESLGDQFIEGAHQMAQAHTEGRLSDERYKQWQDFGEKFKATYHLAVQLWIAAADARDQSLVDQVTAILETLGSQLGTFIHDVSTPSQEVPH